MKAAAERVILAWADGPAGRRMVGQCLVERPDGPREQRWLGRMMERGVELESCTLDEFKRRTKR